MGIIDTLADLTITTEIDVDLCHDESLTGAVGKPLAVVRPHSTDDVSRILRAASAEKVPVIARGSGTGLSGGAAAIDGGLLVVFDQMVGIREIDTVNQVAVVEPGVTLEQLNAALAPHGLVYPVFPGEASASIGGNVGTNAGGMRAIRHGVTRSRVLGLEFVLADGTVVRSGGKFVKSSAGYDLTQLLVGSEGTLGLVTEVTLKLGRLAPHAATVLVPYATLEEIADVIPVIVGSGLEPSVLEYLDLLTMGSVTAAAGVELGIAEDIKAAALAYLVVVLESDDAGRLDEDVVKLADIVSGGLEVYVLPETAANQLIVARERAFFVAKAAGADDIVDAVVPRGAIPAYLKQVADVSVQAQAFVAGCGHAGDGNVHLSIFQPDTGKRKSLMRSIFEIALAMGGAISGEHGLGTEKRALFLELEDPHKIALLRRIKSAFDPEGILGPGRGP